MTIKGSDIVDKTVNLRRGGKAVDRVEEIFFDAKSRRVVGFLLNNLDISGDRRVLPTQSVCEYRDEGLVVEGEYLIQNAFQAGREILAILNNKSYLSHLAVKEIDGSVLGTLSDIYFDSKSGIAEKFEIMRENSDISFSVWECQVAEIDKNSLYIDFSRQPEENFANSAQENGDGEKDSDKNEIDELKRQISKLLSRLDKITEKGPQAFDVLKDNSAKVLFRRKGSNGKSNHALSLTQDPHIHEAVGQYLTKNILLENDDIFAKKGDIVTHNLLHEAEERGALVELLSNISIEKRKYK